MLPVNLTKIIEYLFRNFSDKFNVNQIARSLKISVGSAYKILKSLNKKEILIYQKIGNGIYYNLNLDNKETIAKVQNDFDEGNELGVSGTPTFFINDKKIEGGMPYNSFVAAIDGLLAK